MYENCPHYIPIHKRIWKLIKVRIVIYVFLAVLSIPLKHFVFLLPLFYALILYLRARKINIRYLSKITINTFDCFIEIEVFDSDIFLYREKIPFEICDLKLKEISLGLFSLYQLEFYIKKSKMQLLHKQVTTGAWDLKSFIDIYELVKHSKGEKTYLSTLKKKLPR